MGRPKKQIDPDLVSKLAVIHCTMEEIGQIVGCSVDTLERRFADVIKIAKSKGKSSIRRMQYEAAQKGNTAMLIWLGKQLLGQTEKTVQTIQQTTHVIDIRKKFIADVESEEGA